jgi:hypothetical protein
VEIPTDKVDRLWLVSQTDPFEIRVGSLAIDLAAETADLVVTGQHWFTATLDGNFPRVIAGPLSSIVSMEWRSPED